MGRGSAKVEEVFFAEMQSGDFALRRDKGRIFIFPYEGREVPGLGMMWKRTGELYLLNGKLFSADGVGFVWHDVKAGREVRLSFGGLDPSRPESAQARDQFVLTAGERESIYLAIFMDRSEPGQTVVRPRQIDVGDAEQRLFARVGHRARRVAHPPLP